MCGAVLGAVQAIGLRWGRVDRSVCRQPAIERAAALVGAFHTHFATLACADLVRPFPDMASRARKQHCARIVAFVADWLQTGLDGGAPA
jgi:C_GCAxxG_C_C family probable redox protein